MISHERSEGPLVRILLDTNVFVSAFIFGSASLLDYIDDLVDQKNHGFIELVVPKAVQMELYAILRSGRVERNKQPLFLSHEEITEFIGPYLELFDTDYLLSLNQVSWPQGLLSPFAL